MNEASIQFPSFEMDPLIKFFNVTNTSQTDKTNIADGIW